MDEFGLDRGKERFGDRVVPALTAPADRQADIMPLGEAGVLGAGVLTGFNRSLQHHCPEWTITAR
ncbi:hypothetical protein [Dactylosporangium salmoneum]|uniref:hypothetical protein n=1 Tax=Dactylosporangium salmoneum TaxID=53361 RepID=UPI003CD0594A